MATTSTPDGIGERVRRLIAIWQNGSLKKAARDIGVSRETLRRLRDGDNKYGAREDLLESIAAWYDVPLAWLRTGEGAVPMPTVRGEPLGAWRDWHRVLEPLGLPADVWDAVYRLPFTIRTAIGLTADGKLDPRDASAMYEPEFSEAMTLEVRAWTEFMRGWIRVSGRGAVAATLTRERDALRVGFNLAGLQMLRAKTVDPAELHATAERLRSDVAAGVEAINAATPGGGGFADTVTRSQQHGEALRDRELLAPSNLPKQRVRGYSPPPAVIPPAPEPLVWRFTAASTFGELEKALHACLRGASAGLLEAYTAEVRRLHDSLGTGDTLELVLHPGDNAPSVEVHRAFRPAGATRRAPTRAKRRSRS